MSTTDEDEESGGFFDGGDGDDEPARHRGLLRRHPVAFAFLTLVLVLVLAVGGFLLYLNAQLDQVDQVEVGQVPDKRRPAAVDGDGMNILLAGVDKGDGRSVAEIAAGGWDPGVVRSDTIMVVHLTADRQHAYVVSVPRDSYIRLYDETGRPQRMDKANAAFSLFGPTAYAATIENLTGLRMQHLAVVNWAGFEQITNALGGVRVFVPKTIADEKTGAFQAGEQVLNGEQALRYVRTRYSLPGGDFGRIDRQQNFIRSLVGSLLDNRTLTNPFTLAPTLKAVAGSLTVDDSLDTGEMRSLALSLRGIRSEDVTFVTAPFGRFDTTSSGANIVRLDQPQAAKLWRAVGNDDMESYLSEFGDDAGRLPPPKQVN